MAQGDDSGQIFLFLLLFSEAPVPPPYWDRVYLTL